MRTIMNPPALIAALQGISREEDGMGVTPEAVDEAAPVPRRRFLVVGGFAAHAEGTSWRERLLFHLEGFQLDLTSRCHSCPVEQRAGTVCEERKAEEYIYRESSKGWRVRWAFWTSGIVIVQMVDS